MFAKIQKEASKKLVAHLGVKGAAATVTASLCLTGLGIGLYNERKESKKNPINNTKVNASVPEYRTSTFKS